MKIYFELNSLNKEKAYSELKNVLQSEGITPESEFPTPEEGQMGSAWTGLAALLTGGFFGKLGEAIVKWVENYRSDITLKNRFGEEIQISAKMNKKEIRELIDKFLRQTEQRETQETNIARE